MLIHRGDKLTKLNYNTPGHKLKFFKVINGSILKWADSEDKFEKKSNYHVSLI